MLGVLFIHRLCRYLLRMSPLSTGEVWLECSPFPPWRCPASCLGPLLQCLLWCALFSIFFPFYLKNFRPWRGNIGSGCVILDSILLVDQNMTFDRGDRRFLFVHDNIQKAALHLFDDVSVSGWLRFTLPVDGAETPSTPS